MKKKKDKVSESQMKVMSEISRMANIINKKRISKASRVLVCGEFINNVAKELNITTEEAVEFIDKYFNLELQWGKK